MSKAELAIKDETQQIKKRFAELCDKTNVENPRKSDAKALADFLNEHEGMELWRGVASAGYMAELAVIDNSVAVAALKECWKHRMESLKKEMGIDHAPAIERLLIQQAVLCWLKLSLVELNYSSVMKQSITLTLGMYWEKRLTAAQKRFARACETLARVQKLSRNTPTLQVNIAAEGGQQVNLT